MCFLKSFRGREVHSLLSAELSITLRIVTDADKTQTAECEGNGEDNDGPNQFPVSSVRFALCNSRLHSRFDYWCSSDGSSICDDAFVPVEDMTIALCGIFGFS